MGTIPDPADLDALDRGVVEAGVTAAQAVARIEAVEDALRGVAEGLTMALSALLALRQFPGERRLRPVR